MLLGLLLSLTSFALSCYGCGIVIEESDINEYEDKITPLLQEWKSIVSDWEEAANDPARSPFWDIDTEEAQSQIQNIIASWDAITPPGEAKEYHLFTRHAMDYEGHAFGIMAQYYRLGENSSLDEFTRLRNLATELWILKDKALFDALDSYPY